MAQNFRNDLERNVGTSGSPATLVTGGNYDAVIGIRCCNTSAATISASVYIVNGGNNFFIAKDVSIPPNSAIELIQGGAKIVLKSGDVLTAYASAGTSLDIITSYIDEIST